MYTDRIKLNEVGRIRIFRDIVSVNVPRDCVEGCAELLKQDRGC